jgi:hypothetical protein
MNRGSSHMSLKSHVLRKCNLKKSLLECLLHMSLHTNQRAFYKVICCGVLVKKLLDSIPSTTERKGNEWKEFECPSTGGWLHITRLLPFIG